MGEDLNIKHQNILFKKKIKNDSNVQTALIWLFFFFFPLQVILQNILNKLKGEKNIKPNPELLRQGGRRALANVCYQQ